MNIHQIFTNGIICLVMTLFYSCSSKHDLNLCCQTDNDLYLTLKDNKIACRRYQTPEEAISKAGKGSGVMILADDYPERTTVIDASLFAKAQQKKLRLFIEYPSTLPEMNLDQPRRTELERVVVSTHAIENLANMQILAIHDCHYVPVSNENPLLVVSKVVGFDHAVYGLEGNPDVGAILFEHHTGNLLVSTTKLSQFIKARYAPKEGMQALWSFILQWVGGKSYQLDWTPDVRPTYTRDEKLPDDAARLAIQRGIDWHIHSKMLLSEQGWEEYKKLWKLDDSNMLSASQNVDHTGPQFESPGGDGTFGLLEGIASNIGYDGSQPVRRWLRSDSNGESSLAFALRWAMDGDQRSKLIAVNLLDWIYFNSGLFQQDPLIDNYGLVFWSPDNQALYHDNDIKIILGCIGTAGILETDRWDETLTKNILGNFRTTGRNGFRGHRLENANLLRDGWKSYWERNTILYQPHYEVWVWSSYLWLYDKTKWKPLFDRTLKAIKIMMEGYPDNWNWTNGFQQERGRMLLPLAWLIRVDDRPEYRAWLKQIAGDMEKCQDESGAIREELGILNRGSYAPPASNAEYGTSEASLIQSNDDQVADLLYTCNFTFLGLHEAYAATGDPQYKRMADKLAEFLIRIQVKSDKHNNLDGGWFRAFDFRQWEYWGSNADHGWGAWCIEAGWTQAWIPTVLRCEKPIKISGIFQRTARSAKILTLSANR